ncbi:type I restriction-modification system subunit M [Marinoscillum furvescens]|uniref:site-specific DNA-methyltransferase (adenine-specific) n=1 Tax=Marinoscillum furvescens DSM 4134 TaxID=1122208 RepID=A0A3D9KYU8_MARFU|nr:class I SAM-dependent DNA methyltransferase [Marinoscillum furvescens]RED94645.1 type I restriction enzyme M protein [Marinoscillum furvescens DSM 4134]
MNHKSHNQIINFIWGIADDVLRDVFVRGKYRDIMLPFTVLRRLDVLLEPTKEAVLEANQFLIDNKIDSKEGLKNKTGYPFFNTSRFTMGLNSPKDAKFPFASLMSDPDHIDSNLEEYLDGFSDNVQEIISKFKIRNQLETMKDAGITYSLIEKFTSNEINLSTTEKKNSKGEKLPPLTNLGMGYVFEELIRKFNEENNEEAGEHFTPREIIRLMTHVIFEPIKDDLKEHGTYSIYDPACGSGGMLTESEDFALEISNEKKCKFYLYGQEVNPETYAICTSDMLIKGESPENIAFGSTLSRDGFPNKEFDFMLSNPPYGKSWKVDMDFIVGEKKKILDLRFTKGVPRSSDGQLLFLSNMAYKMKKRSELGSRVASVHNGSALFTGDAGSGESEIRRWLIENDWLDCIIGLPKNMFYNTGINTYIFILNNKKPERRKGKIQLIDASEIYQKMRRSLGSKSHELTDEHINQITQLYLDFRETEQSKIFNNEDFGYQKIIVERPLRLKAQLKEEVIEELMFHSALQEEMKWIYSRIGEAVYENLADHKETIFKYWEKNEISVKPADKKKLLDVKFWQKQREIQEVARLLKSELGDTCYDDFNSFKKDVDKAYKKHGIKPDNDTKKQLLNAFSWKDESAEKVIKKKEKARPGRDVTIIYEPDAELRDSEQVPLTEDIDEYFEKEVLPHVPDAWIDYDKTLIGYEISFTRHFYKYQPLRSLSEITKDIMALEKETEGLLKEIVE